MILIVAPPEILRGPKSDSQAPSEFASDLILLTVASSIDPDCSRPTEA